MARYATASANPRVKTIIICGACAALLAVGGLMAYFTDTATKVNTFTLGEGGLTIQVDEPTWEGDPTGVLPGAEYDKDPMIKNTQGVNAWIVAEVKVPLGIIGGQTVELFNITGNNTADWTQIGTYSDEGSYRTYTYGYKAPVAAGASTTAIFTDVQLKDMSEAEFEAINTTFNGALTITIDATGIQSDNTGFANAAAAWADVNA